MVKDLKKGDKVTWKSPQGKISGTVEKTVTQDTRIKGHVARASKADPKVMVRSGKTGAKAVHKPDSVAKE